MSNSTSPTSPPPQQPHILLFPFMSKGHTIPLLHLATLLHHHRPRATFTIFTTPANHPFISTTMLISSTIPSHLFTIISLPFAAAFESTDQLPSMSHFYDFISDVEQLQPAFESSLHALLTCRDNHVKPLVLISDGFLHWTQYSASKFNIPRLVFYGMSCYVHTICGLVGRHGILRGYESDDEPIQVPDFPWIKVTRNDFEPPFNKREPKGRSFEFVMRCAMSDSKSYGLVINSFFELESKFLDYFNANFETKLWPIGPFCLVDKPKTKLEKQDKPIWLEWLDRKKESNKHVLYIAFGSQAEISNEQLKEILIGLENSEIDFIWALRIKPNQDEIMKGFEEKVKDHGLILKGWAQQKEILAHESVVGFLSHCGWNSVTESICAGVPILAWPMMAEQHLNARFVVEEIRVGLRVETSNGSVRGFVKGAGLSKMVKELINGEMGNEVRKRVKEVSLDAKRALEEDGSSWKNLEMLLNELECMESSLNCDGGMVNGENDSSVA